MYEWGGTSKWSQIISFLWRTYERIYVNINSRCPVQGQNLQTSKKGIWNNKGEQHWLVLEGGESLKLPINEWYVAICSIINTYQQKLNIGFFYFIYSYDEKWEIIPFLWLEPLI